MEKMCILSLGGSLIVPEEIDSAYLKEFKKVIEEEASKGWKFVIVTGGGRTARKYIQAAQDTDETITDEDKDWLGIHSTRMNAQLVRTIFRDIAHPRINTNPHDLEDFYSFKESVLVAAGWRPGFSTDYDAVVLAKYLDIVKVVNFSNIDYAYTEDPKVNPQAEKIENITWTDFRKIVGSEWSPGLNAPFDPIASKLAQEAGLEVVILNGKNLTNFQSYLAEGAYIGTTISGE
jgi:uridylate kinase